MNEIFSFIWKCLVPPVETCKGNNFLCKEKKKERKRDEDR